MTPHARTVEVIYPTQAPHLAPIAAEIGAQRTRQLEQLDAPTVRRLLDAGAAIARAREAFARFRNRIGIDA